MAKRRVTPTENSNGEVIVQLATRIPRPLQKRLKLYSVESGVSISDFVAEAIEARLDEVSAAKPKRAKKAAEAA